MSFRIGSFIQAAAEERRATEAHDRVPSQALVVPRDRSIPYRRRQAAMLPALECQSVVAPTLLQSSEAWALAALR